jgi:flagellar biosynthesis GTPase FlhF
MSPEIKTFRGLSLAEVETKVRAELGDDAVVVRQREGLSGGVGGFFQRRLYEVDAMAGSVADAVVAADELPAPPPQMPADAPVSEVRDDFLSQLKSALTPEVAQTAAEQRLVQEAAAFIPEPLVAEPTPPVPAAPAAVPSAAALAAMFAPDVPREPVAWPEEEDIELEAAPVEPEIEILPPAPVAGVFAAPAAAAPLPVVAPKAGLPAHWPAGAARLQGRLTDRGVSDELTSEVLDEAVTHLLPFSSHGRLKPLVASALARRIPVQPLHGAGGRVVGFVGPGGSGKTRSVARLAHAYAVRSQVPVACIALRAEDEGAELQRLVRPFGVNVHAIADAAEARARIASFPEGTLVLVDTPGVSPRAEAELRALATELRQLQLDECHLAVPATMSRSAGRDLVEGTRSLGVGALAMTHVDETERLGSVVELAIETSLPVSYIGRGTIVTGGLRPALPEELAAAVVA